MLARILTNSHEVAVVVGDRLSNAFLQVVSPHRFLVSSMPLRVVACIAALQVVSAEKFFVSNIPSTLAMNYSNEDGPDGAGVTLWYAGGLQDKLKKALEIKIKKWEAQLFHNKSSTRTEHLGAMFPCGWSNRAGRRFRHTDRLN